MATDKERLAESVVDKNCVSVSGKRVTCLVNDVDLIAGDSKNSLLLKVETAKEKNR
jgi:hypothetical protein